ncbi:MAG: beta-hydroxyacyl-ACP dehydratase [Planctomycetota bacterium]|nr:beta-hydroxyacyl-ACP dehydratase [Planctomycetota bacterium]
MRFLLVDRIVALTPDTSIEGFKTVAMSEDYLEWHFPERPILPGMLILEACAQLAGWLEAASSDFAHWVLLDHVRSARYYKFAIPGDRVDIRLERLPLDDPERRAYRAETSQDGQRGAAIEFEARVIPLEGLESGARARAAFAVLRGASA